MATPEQWADAILRGGISFTPEALKRAVDAANAYVAANPPDNRPTAWERLLASLSEER
jgi:hypothetical protein